MSNLDIVDAAMTIHERMDLLYKQDRAAFRRYLKTAPASFEAPRMEWLVLRNLNRALFSQLGAYSQMMQNLLSR